MTLNLLLLFSLFINSFVYSLIHSFIHTYIYSSAHSFVRCFFFLFRLFALSFSLSPFLSPFLSFFLFFQGYKKSYPQDTKIRISTSGTLHDISVSNFQTKHIPFNYLFCVYEIEDITSSIEKYSLSLEIFST